ncbi:hypothetical protein MKZ38_001839 [Zalerion maritima]|uniref:Uncharacterized protein n=1 Tax=Zalerion maritima TaxID=339359 RepID=A0AAD5RR11_9PEZI|nr:hypothetical protein MKZ38_001839 [Zalerion maritima]
MQESHEARSFVCGISATKQAEEEKKKKKKKKRKKLSISPKKWSLSTLATSGLTFTYLPASQSAFTVAQL